jgi:hypothetical protein
LEDIKFKDVILMAKILKVELGECKFVVVKLVVKKLELVIFVILKIIPI